MNSDWQGFSILLSFVFLGMAFSFLNQAIKGTLWGGDAERNPLTAQFWKDLCIYFFVERVGRSCMAAIVGITTTLGLVNGLIDVQHATILNLLAAGVSAGFISDIVINRAGN